MAAPLTSMKSAIVAIIAAGSGVIAASGIPAERWPLHVFRGIASGFIGARNRGRLPYVEVDDLGGSARERSTAGVSATATVRVRIRTNEDAEREQRPVMDELSIEIQKAMKTSTRFMLAGVSEGAHQADHASAYKDLDFSVQYPADRVTMGDA